MTENDKTITLKLVYAGESKRSICFDSPGRRAWIERGQIRSRQYVGDGVFLITIPAELAIKKKLTQAQEDSTDGRN